MRDSNVLLNQLCIYLINPVLTYIYLPGNSKQYVLNQPKQNMLLLGGTYFKKKK